MKETIGGGGKHSNQHSIHHTESFPAVPFSLVLIIPDAIFQPRTFIPLYIVMYASLELPTTESDLRTFSKPPPLHVRLFHWRI